MIELGQTGDSRRFAFFSGHLAQSFEKAFFRDAGGPLADGIRIGNSESGDEGLPRDALAMDMLPEVVIILANPGGPQAVAHRVVTIGPVHHVFIRVERFPVGEKVVSPLLLHPCASKFARDLGPGILLAIFRAAYAVSTAEMGVQLESRVSADPAGDGFLEFDLELAVVEAGIGDGLPPSPEGAHRIDSLDQIGPAALHRMKIQGATGLVLGANPVDDFFFLGCCHGFQGPWNQHRDPATSRWKCTARSVVIGSGMRWSRSDRNAIGSNTGLPTPALIPTLGANYAR